MLSAGSCAAFRLFWIRGLQLTPLDTYLEISIAKQLGVYVGKDI